MLQTRKERTLRLVQIALLAAIELIFAFTPLGYLRVGTVLEITFMTIPIAIAATTVGPLACVFLSLIFGVSSFLQCFGMSAFGVICLSIDPLRTAVLCIVPRLLMGVLAGYIFQWLKKTGRSLLAFTLTSLSAALLNTVFFVLAFFLLFRNAALDFGGTVGVINVGAMSLAQVFIFLAGINGVVEVIACTVLSTAIGKALAQYLLPAIGKKAHMTVPQAVATVEPETTESTVCPHCNAQFKYHSTPGTCPYCGLSCRAEDAARAEEPEHEDAATADEKDQTPQ